MKDQIEPGLYQATRKTYRQAVDTGFGKVKFGETDYDFLQALKQNTDVLAAFKTHRQQNDIARLMITQEGKLKPFEQFRSDVEGIIGKYNRDWLTTEYNTAVIRARHAARWKDFERDKDIYPNLKWLPTTSVQPDTKVHGLFWNRIWPVVSPFWRKHYPGDRWNCKCGLTNTDEPETDNADLYDRDEFKQYKPDIGIDANAGLTAEIFTDRHPYIEEAYPGAKKAVKTLLDNEKPDKLRRKEIQKEAAVLKETVLTNPDFGNEIQVTMKGIKEWLNQPHQFYAQKNEMLLTIKEVLQKAKYLGYGPDKHDVNVKAHLFEIDLEGEKSWIIAREYLNGEINLHSISDSEKILNIL